MEFTNFTELIRFPEAFTWEAFLSVVEKVNLFYERIWGLINWKFCLSLTWPVLNSSNVASIVELFNQTRNFFAFSDPELPPKKIYCALWDKWLFLFSCKFSAEYGIVPNSKKLANSAEKQIPNRKFVHP